MVRVVSVVVLTCAALLLWAGPAGACVELLQWKDCL